MITQRYYDEYCIASQPDERPFGISLLVRIYTTWETKKKGLKREKWEQKILTVIGQTPEDAARKLKRLIERKELLPFSVAGREADELRKELAEIDARLDERP
jgi:hypothetical protein